MTNQPTIKKYLFSNVDATLYYLQGDTLMAMPQMNDDTFSADEAYEVELDNDEVPENYFKNLIVKLKA